jgi:tetratricopeptide repeat protein 30
LEAKITQQTSPEEAFRKFEELGVKQIDSLRKLTKDV